MALSTVKLTFSGLLVLHFKKGMTRCHVGIPRDVPHHEPGMNVVVRTALGSVTVLQLRREDFQRSAFRLRVENCPQTGRIKPLEFDNFIRKEDVGHENDFRWAMDFEDELYKKDIGHVKDSWLSWLGIDGGDFFTEKKSEDKLQTYFENSPDKVETHGRVAVIVGGRIDLDKVGSQVVLQRRGKSKGATWENVFTCLPVPGVQYGFDLSQAVPPGTVTPPEHRRHANFYYNSVGSKLTKAEKKYFRSPEEEEPSALQKEYPRMRADDFVDPRAICFVGNMGRTLGNDSLFAGDSAEGEDATGGAAGQHHDHAGDHGDAPGGGPAGERG